MMDVFVSTDHDGHYPVGVASVVVAEDEERARLLLNEELKAHGLSPAVKYTLRRLNTGAERAFVLLDGDY